MSKSRNKLLTLWCSADMLYRYLTFQGSMHLFRKERCDWTLFQTADKIIWLGPEALKDTGNCLNLSCLFSKLFLFKNPHDRFNQILYLLGVALRYNWKAIEWSKALLKPPHVLKNTNNFLNVNGFFHKALSFEKSKRDQVIVSCKYIISWVTLKMIERPSYRVAWPSGLRRWFKAPVSSEARVRISPLPPL